MANLSRDDHGMSPTSDLPAAVRGVAALGMERERVDGPGSRWVDDGYVGVGPGAEGPLGDAQEPGGLYGQLADRFGPGQVAGLDQAEDGDWDQGFEPDDPKRGLVQLPQLLLGRVRRMVGGEEVDGPVAEATDHGIDVGLCA